MTPRDLARLLLGICTTLTSKATELEMRLGALPRLCGDGAATAAEELETLIAEAAGITDGDIDFWRGDLLVGVTSPVIHMSVVNFDGTAISRTYRSGDGEDSRLNRYVRMPLQSVRMVALELMGGLT